MATSAAHHMIGMPHPPSLVQQMFLAQHQAAAAAAAAQYVNMLQQHQQQQQQQQQQQSHVIPNPASDVMTDNQSIPPPATSTDQRELGPFHWMTPTVAAAAAYPGSHFAAGLYGNLHMQQLFHPTFHQQGLAPPPSNLQPEGEMGVAGGLFIPPMGPEQQRLMQRQLAASHKQSQAIPIIDPKLVSFP